MGADSSSVIRGFESLSKYFSFLVIPLIDIKYIFFIYFCKIKMNEIILII